MNNSFIIKNMKNYSHIIKISLIHFTFINIDFNKLMIDYLKNIN